MVLTVLYCLLGRKLIVEQYDAVISVNTIKIAVLKEKDL
jgi:hypothetical protein